MTRRKRTPSPGAKSRKRSAGNAAGQPIGVPNSFENLSEHCRDLRRQTDALNGKLKVLTNGRQTTPTLPIPTRSPPKAPSLPQDNGNPMPTSTLPSNEGPKAAAPLMLPAKPSAVSARAPTPCERVSAPQKAPILNAQRPANVAPGSTNDGSSADRAELIRRKLAENAANGMTYRLSRVASSPHPVGRIAVQMTASNSSGENASQTVNGLDGCGPVDRPSSYAGNQSAGEPRRIHSHPCATVPPNAHPRGFEALSQAILNPISLRSPSVPKHTSIPDSEFKKAAQQLTFDPNVFPASMSTSPSKNDNTDRNNERSPTPSADLITQLQASVQAYPISPPASHSQSSPIIPQPAYPSSATGSASSRRSHPRHIEDQGTMAANFMASRPTHGYHKIKLKYWNSIPSIPDQPVRAPVSLPSNATTPSTSAPPASSSQPPSSTASVALPNATDSWRAVGDTFYGRIGPVAIKEGKNGRFKNLTQGGFQKYNAGGKLVGADPAIYQYQESSLQEVSAGGTEGNQMARAKNKRDTDINALTLAKRGNATNQDPALSLRPPLSTVIHAAESPPRSHHSSRAGTEEREVRRAMEEFERGDLAVSGSDGGSASSSDGVSTPITPGAE